MKKKKQKIVVEESESSDEDDHYSTVSTDDETIQSLINKEIESSNYMSEQHDNETFLCIFLKKTIKLDDTDRVSTSVVVCSQHFKFKDYHHYRFHTLIGCRKQRLTKQHSKKVKNITQIFILVFVVNPAKSLQHLT
ncbi:hypothetical protein RN001_001781 [Aquatica leii]|uniref:Uncharacterized protein n=1 Tax=Aquatica leii TaxID=1421715 RepID=A0AAN7SSQ0_9COLE|nr:hypothetical protein RN001_001781 [Aquatica leii]